MYPDYVLETRPQFNRQYIRPAAMLVLDTETRTDAIQRLTFGSYQFIVNGGCMQEGLFYADDLPATDRKTIERYIADPRHQADAVDKRLHLLTRREFNDLFFRAAYKGRCLVVAFNFPFDVSRIAYDFTNARDPRFIGGFSLGLWSYIDKLGGERRHQYRPRIDIKHIDSKRALKGFTGRQSPDEIDRIPEGSQTGKAEEAYKFRGHFLDLRTLAFALTDRGYTLESACDDFDVEHKKHPVARHGEVTEEYIDYNRGDVLATAELAVKLLEEYDRHPIALQETRAYSPASIGKAYLREMGITPVLVRQPDFPKKCLGYAESAFFGGRTSAHIRKIAVPAVYTDFLSMYPTVNSLMDLWRFVIADKIDVIEHCETEIQHFLAGLTANTIFTPATWKLLTAFVKVIPDGDILPSRSRYNKETRDWQVGVNHLYADEQNALWYSLPDVAASVLLNNGRVPKIVDAFRIEPHGTLSSLKPVKLRNAIEVDPSKQDFFRVVIEERKRLSSRTNLSDTERDRLDKALKVLANATSYGIYAEMNRQESEQKINVTCYGIDATPYLCRVKHPDAPGEYCFPPLASLITGAARLMLALLEHCVVREAGGTYAMEDTDSMAVVATEHRGTITSDDNAFNTLSWKRVDEISHRFAALNPDNRDAIPGSVLKIEDDNYDPITHQQRQLYCFAISAKRYDLFLIDENSNPVLLRSSCSHCGTKNKPGAVQCKNEKCRRPVRVNNRDDRWSEHGLGHLLNPTDPESDDREWIAQAWENISRRALGVVTQQVRFAQSPAVKRITVSSPAVMRPFKQFNDGKRYVDQIKPFNFLLTCHVLSFGHPTATKHAERFHLIAPYDNDPRHWLAMEWIDQYSEEHYHITTAGHHGTRNTARVKTYGDVLLEYEFHPESKCADASGKPCNKQTVGLLQRRHIRVDHVKYIGKESNSLEEVEAQIEPLAQNVYTEYPDPRRDEWATKIVPALKIIPLRTLQKRTGLSRRMLIKARTGQTRPHEANREKLTSIAREHGLI